MTTIHFNGSIGMYSLSLIHHVDSWTRRGNCQKQEEPNSNNYGQMISWTIDPRGLTNLYGPWRLVRKKYLSTNLVLETL